MLNNMIKQYDFHERNNLSIEQSVELINFLKSQSDVKEIEDVSKDQSYQKQDIDLIIIYTDLTEVTVEIKVDNQIYRTNNFFFETISNDVKNTPGCFFYSKANKFYYFDSHSGDLFIIDLLTARAWFNKNIDSFEEVSTSTISNYKILYRTFGRLIPKKIILNESFIHQLNIRN